MLGANHISTRTGQIVEGRRETMKLGQLITGMSHCQISGDPEQPINGLAYDSRQVKPGNLFVALRGHERDGHDYLGDALERGAMALVGESFLGIGENVTKVRVDDSREALSRLSIQFYNHPFDGLNLIGITGTNGKTTTSYLLESILTSAGAKPGVVGTINYRYSGKSHPAPVTTPESLDLMRFLREMADDGVTDVIVEVSSHALDQKRTEGCPFKVAIFTNFSRDHLDYHHTMENYFRSKSLLFSDLLRNGQSKKNIAILNMDDPKGVELAALTQAEIMTYGLREVCDVGAESIASDKAGLKGDLITPQGKRTFQSPLIGEINVYNILAASAAAIALDIDLDSVVEGIERLERVPGRLEPVRNKRGLTIVVDYAHTPDALLKALRDVRPFVKGKLITVFGCGGDRDKGKRPEMGRVAGEHSDLVFITSDNPRREEPMSIIGQIEKGTQESGMKRVGGSSNHRSKTLGYIMEVDRETAIRQAISEADIEDFVLIAGKGHEDYQIVGRERRHFDDREVAASAAQ
jgi:UDP-N-acetylmuramoyl-L-alanyl-D-glutamate--2,6-diaminopimelate ligase